MRTTLELNPILYIILTGVTSHVGLGFNRALLFLVNKKERRLECKMAIGPESGEHADKVWRYITDAKQELKDLIETDRIPESVYHSSLYMALKDLVIPLSKDENNLLASAYRIRTPMHITPDIIKEYQSDPLLKVFPTKELVIMPLKAKDIINGLIIADNLYTQKPINDDDIKMFTMLANQAGLAIENSQLYEMVVQQSHTDSLTNLWNHGFFQQTLAEEIGHAEKEKTPLSLAIMDIDNFKQLNDSYGHQNGDIVLKELAQLLKESSRVADYVCRYGGEEFSIILPHTTHEQSYEICERMRKNIASHQFRHFPNPELKVTVSIGLATYPDRAKDKEELIANADKAMYIAKFSGKNKTCLVT
jgi:diguanylate cyclase (GGDEF)-like protein